MEETALQPPTPEQIEKYHRWWAALSTPWKTAFNEVFLQQTTDKPVMRFERDAGIRCLKG